MRNLNNILKYHSDEACSYEQGQPNLTCSSYCAFIANLSGRLYLIQKWQEICISNLNGENIVIRSSRDVVFTDFSYGQKQTHLSPQSFQASLAHTNRP